MRKLQRFVQAHSILCKFNLAKISFSLSLLKFGDPDFDKSFEVVSSVSEVSNCIDVEWILSHANGVRFKHLLLDMDLFVDSLAIFFHSLSQFFFKKFCVLIDLPVRSFRTVFFLFLFIIYKLVLDLLEFSLGKRESFSSPLPLEVSLAVILWLIEGTTCTNLLIDN